MKNVKLLKKESLYCGIDHVKFEVNGHVVSAQMRFGDFCKHGDFTCTLYGYGTGYNYYLPANVKQDVTKEEASKWLAELRTFLNEAAYC